MKGGLAGRSHSDECKSVYRHRGRKCDPVMTATCPAKRQALLPDYNIIVILGSVVVNISSIYKIERSFPLNKTAV